MTEIQIDQNQIPEHIAIIMDGNGRWARVKTLPRIAGHKQGVKAVRNITEICGELGVKHLTLYTFSEENWNRPQMEVSALMKLLVSSLKKEVKDLNKNNVRFTVIGDVSKMDNFVQNELYEAIELTQNNDGLNLNLALSYGGRQEIINAFKGLYSHINSTDEITEELFESHLYTSNIPDPDLLIRTGGELRVSNFLLWQIAYTEFHITNTFWPAFGREELLLAISDYQQRERRFGKISEQIQ
ncbi:MAG: isoprenyl transferase [Candidatus Marinimicrobia bacterium]|nr:isoprenyl transferase [Candidatus Neomarinimicrobiota bacterium]MBT6870996.1 isoprenyl transferase [Candidatus Neomarinimicrobiota bacterium]MBT7377619.1 isoprenyl transferase [Candidatus Neomarinimicrobiota bacterium]